MKQKNESDQQPESGANWILDLWNKEWPVIRGAPISFTVCVLIICALFSVAVFRYTDSQYAATISAKNATIESKDAFIQRLSTRTDSDKIYKNLPVTDPHVKGRPWSNGGVLMISEG